MSTRTSVNSIVRENIAIRTYRHYIVDSILIVKRSGFKELLRRRGKKFFLGIIAYYLVRDTLLYVVLPFLIAKGIF